MKKNIIYIVFAIIAVAFATGCKVGPKFQKSTPPMGDNYRYDSLQLALQDSLLNIRWWELFDDPIIDTLIRIGLEENRDVQIAATRIEQSRAIVGVAKADYWPNLGYQGVAQRGNFVQGVPTGGTGNIFAGFGTVNWEIDFWGKFRRSTEAARADLLASEFGYRTVQIGLISQIAGTYFLWLDYKWRLEISVATVQLRQASLDIIQQRYNQGIIPEIDLNQAQIQLAIAKAAIPIFQRQMAQTENALNVLLGRNPGPIQQGVDLENQNLPPDIPVGLPSMLLERRPDVLQSQELARAQNARIGVAQAQRFPAISLTGILGVASNDLSTLTSNGLAWNASGTFLGPIFNFNKNKRRVEVERYKAEQAMLEYEKTVLGAFREVEDALVEISTLKTELQARRDHVNAAVNARGLSQERYDKGVTSYLELLESQRQAFEAELKLSETTQQLFNAYIKLYKALGGGWLSQQEEIDANNAQNNQ